MDSWIKFAVSGGSEAKSGHVPRGPCPYLNQQDAQQLDVDLMEEVNGFSLDQLMELAGQAVAMAAATEYPIKHLSGREEEGGVGKVNRGVAVVVGPGNNGGDGWVAARHLAHFGYDVAVVNAPGEKTFNKFDKLVKQCEGVGVTVLNLDALPEEKEGSEQESVTSLVDWFYQRQDLFVVDAMLGFSAKGEPRGVYKRFISALARLGNVVSVDIPSGWDVEKGDLHGTNFSPRVLVSLTAPKLGTKQFTGRHLLGGRFVPHSLRAKYKLDDLPPYLGTDYVTLVHGDRDQGTACDLSIGSSIPVPR